MSRRLSKPTFLVGEGSEKWDGVQKYTDRGPEQFSYAIRKGTTELTKGGSQFEERDC